MRWREGCAVLCTGIAAVGEGPRGSTKKTERRAWLVAVGSRHSRSSQEAVKVVDEVYSKHNQSTRNVDSMLTDERLPRNAPTGRCGRRTRARQDPQGLTINTQARDRGRPTTVITSPHSKHVYDRVKYTAACEKRNFMSSCVPSASYIKIGLPN